MSKSLPRVLVWRRYPRAWSPSIEKFEKMDQNWPVIAHFERQYYWEVDMWMNELMRITSFGTCAVWDFSLTKLTREHPLQIAGSRPALRFFPSTTMSSSV